MSDLERLAAWFISQSAKHHACTTGDCPHDTTQLCAEMLVAQFAGECGLREPPIGVAVKAVESLVINEDVKGLLISVPGNISDEGIHRLQQNWEEAFAGTRAGKTPTVVLCDGVSVSTVVEPVGTYDLRHMGEQDTTPCMMCGGAGEHSDQTGEGTVMCGSCSGEGEVPVDDGECGGWCESSQ